MAKRGKAAKPARATKRKATPKSKPKKQRLSQTPEAKKARAYRARKRIERELAAKKAEQSKRKRRKRERERRLERESIELGESTRIEEEREADARRADGDERQLFADILDDMRNIGSAIVPLSLTLTEPEVGARTPWLVVGRFDCVDAPTYAELDEVFSTWRDDLILEAKIHPQRFSQIRIVYEDPKAKRGESDSIVSHSGPWEAVISEISFELDPDDEDSLASRYEHTTVPIFYVYFSSQLSIGAEVSL